MLESFPNSDTSQEPQVSDPGDKRWILNAVSFCLMNLGRLGEAAPFLERVAADGAAAQDWRSTSTSYRNLAALHAYLGALAASADAAREALALVHRTGNKQDEWVSLTWVAKVAHLRGEVEAAGRAIKEAEALQREINPNVSYLYGNGGILQADHLRRAGDAAYARRVTEANLEICERNHWPDDLSQCHRVLGDLDAGTEEHERARQHYDEALKIARGISRRDVLIEALLARGRWAARRGDVAAARGDLDEALGYAATGGYRIYEADIRVGLAWAHRAAGDAAAARAEAERARQTSAEMEYRWGQVDAAEVLAAIEAAAGGPGEG